MDTSQLWVKKWENGILETGIVSIDSLFENYALNVKYIGKRQNRYDVVIKTDYLMNPIAIVQKLRGIQARLDMLNRKVLMRVEGIILRWEDYRIYRYFLGWGRLSIGVSLSSCVESKSSK